MRRFLLLISILCITLLAAPAVRAQNTFPATEGERMRYSVQIDFGKAYLSGIGIQGEDSQHYRQAKQVVYPPCHKERHEEGDSRTQRRRHYLYEPKVSYNIHV